MQDASNKCSVHTHTILDITTRVPPRTARLPHTKHIHADLLAARESTERAAEKGVAGYSQKQKKGVDTVRCVRYNT